MSKFKIQMDDTVIVTTGKHKGATGRVIDVDNENGRVLIEQVNLALETLASALGLRSGH